MELEPLNVLIGPNGSGKSNFMEVLGMLRAAPNDLFAPIRDGGGGHTWIWRGDREVPEGRLEVTIRSSHFLHPELFLRYSLTFNYNSFLLGMSIRGEIVEDGQYKKYAVASDRYLERMGAKATLRYYGESGREKST